MTALKKYARLEATGLWRPIPDAQRREVAVSFGNASLVLSDPRTAEPLSHWSLPAVHRRNPGAMPALYAPGQEAAAETLELDDPEMIGAIEIVRATLARRRPRRGRLRLMATAVGLLGLAVLAVVWLPDAVTNHTARVLPMVTRQEIGLALARESERFTGAPCAASGGAIALEALVGRLFGGDGTRVLILREGLPPGQVVALPGRVLLADRRLVETQNGPEVLAGHLITERMRADLDDPMLRLLENAGLTAGFTLLTTGTLPEAALAGQARLWLQPATAPLPDPDRLLARFAASGLPSTPYALSVDPTGRDTLALIEGDPVPDARARALMPDADWLALQGICAR